MRRSGSWQTGPQGGKRRRLPGGGWEYYSRKHRSGRSKKRGRPSHKVGNVVVRENGTKWQKTESGWKYLGVAVPKYESQKIRFERLVEEKKKEQVRQRTIADQEKKRRAAKLFYVETDSGYYSFTVEQYKNYLVHGMGKEGGVLELEESEFGTKMSRKPKGSVKSFFELGLAERAKRELEHVHAQFPDAERTSGDAAKSFAEVRREVIFLAKSFMVHREISIGSVLNVVIFKAAKPPGSGWEGVPKGKHGGYRRAVGATESGGTKYEYWYPSQGAASAAAQHHGKMAKQAQKKLGRLLRKKGVKQEQIESLLDAYDSASESHDEVRRLHAKGVASQLKQTTESVRGYLEEIRELQGVLADPDTSGEDKKKIQQELDGMNANVKKWVAKQVDLKKQLKQMQGYAPPSVDAPVKDHNEHIDELKDRAKGLSEQVQEADDQKAKGKAAVELHNVSVAYGEAKQARETARFNESFPSEDPSLEDQTIMDLTEEIADLKAYTPPERTEKVIKDRMKVLEDYLDWGEAFGLDDDGKVLTKQARKEHNELAKELLELGSERKAASNFRFVDLVKASRAGPWQAGPRGGTRRMLPGGEWEYKTNEKPKRGRRKALKKKTPSRRSAEGKAANPWRKEFGKHQLTKYPPPGYDKSQVEVSERGDTDAHWILRWKDETRNSRFPEGKTQSAYTPGFYKRRDAAKWERVKSLISVIEGSRSHLESRVQNGSLPEKERRAAACALLIALTGARVGSGGEERVGVYGTYGASTVEKRHISIKRGKLTMRFHGKDKVENVFETDNKVLVGWMKKRLPQIDHRVKQVFNLKYKEVRAAMDSASMEGFTPKDLRSVVAAEAAAEELASTAPPKRLPKDPKEAKMILLGILKDVSERVGKRLNNSKHVAKRHYIPPPIYAAWLDQIGASKWKHALLEITKAAITKESLLDQAKSVTLFGHDQKADLGNEDYEIDEPDELEAWSMVIPIAEAQ